MIIKLLTITNPRDLKNNEYKLNFIEYAALIIFQDSRNSLRFQVLLQ